jgi:hypothetical protein
VHEKEIVMAKTESNRKNALRSTGPRTPEGRAVVAQNAVKHGAYSEALTMLLEKPEDFEALRGGMSESLQPVGPLELGIVDRLASLWWRMNRAKLVANQSLWLRAKKNTGYDPVEALQDSLLGLGDSVALDRDECRLGGAWNSDQQDRLLRHEMTLERSFFRALHELERIQAQRKGQPVLPPVVLDVTLAETQD